MGTKNTTTSTKSGIAINLMINYETLNECRSVVNNYSVIGIKN